MENGEIMMKNLTNLFLIIFSGISALSMITIAITTIFNQKQANKTIKKYHLEFTAMLHALIASNLILVDADRASNYFALQYSRISDFIKDKIEKS